MNHSLEDPYEKISMAHSVPADSDSCLRARSDFRRNVDADYLLLGGDRVVIALGDYDRERALVIDPVLAYSSYFGGTGKLGR